MKNSTGYYCKYITNLMLVLDVFISSNNMESEEASVGQSTGAKIRAAMNTSNNDFCAYMLYNARCYCHRSIRGDVINVKSLCNDCHSFKI